MSSAARARTLALTRVHQEDSTLRLLRADNAPLILGLLSTHLGGEQRRLSAAELYSRIDADLDEMRGQGMSLPLTAQRYCADWRSQGFLDRRAAAESREETFELSPATTAAIRIVADLEAPPTRATESRLMSIASQLSRLAVETDPDLSRRLDAHLAERARIDQAIARVEAGDVDLLDPERATERLVDIVAQAREVPSDFARVRTEFEELNRLLRQQILESEAAGGQVLAEVFRGVDLIEESPAGRTFRAFSQLILDEELGATFDANLERVLGQQFAHGVPATQRRLLRRFLRSLKQDNSEISRVLTTFARGLRRYVQSQEYQRDRVLRGLLRDATARGVAAAPAVRPWAPTDLELELSSVSLSSLGMLRLYDPAEDLPVDVSIEDNPVESVDLNALRTITRETEIDFDELNENVRLVLLDHERATIGDVLDRFPATQGVASVAGLMALATDRWAQRDTEHPRTMADPDAAEPSGATERADTTERVSWVGGDDTERYAQIPLHTFERTNR